MMSGRSGATDWQTLGTKFTIAIALLGLFGSAVVGWINNDRRLTTVEQQRLADRRDIDRNYVAIANNTQSIRILGDQVQTTNEQINSKLDRILVQTR